MFWFNYFSSCSWFMMIKLMVFVWSIEGLISINSYVATWLVWHVLFEIYVYIYMSESLDCSIWVTYGLVQLGLVNSLEPHLFTLVA